MSALSTYNLITTTYLFEELLQGFDVFIGHICYGVGVGAAVSYTHLTLPTKA